MKISNANEARDKARVMRHNNTLLFIDKVQKLIEGAVFKGAMSIVVVTDTTIDRSMFRQHFEREKGYGVSCESKGDPNGIMPREEYTITWG